MIERLARIHGTAMVPDAEQVEDILQSELIGAISGSTEALHTIASSVLDEECVAVAAVSGTCDESLHVSGDESADGVKTFSSGIVVTTARLPQSGSELLLPENVYVSHAGTMISSGALSALSWIAENHEWMSEYGGITTYLDSVLNSFESKHGGEYGALVRRVADALGAGSSGAANPTCDAFCDAFAEWMADKVDVYETDGTLPSQTETDAANILVRFLSVLGRYNALVNEVGTDPFPKLEGLTA